MSIFTNSIICIISWSFLLTFHCEINVIYRKFPEMYSIVPCAFHPVSPNGTGCITIVLYKNQEIDIGTICRVYSDLTSFTCIPLCVYVCVCSSMEFHV